MRKRINLVLFFALIVILAACTTRNSDMSTTPSVTPGIPTPQDAPLQPPAAALAAQGDLAQVLGLPAAQVTIRAVEAKEWPDACLGMAKAEEVCAAVITPGFRILLTAGGSEYEYRSNQDGSVLRRGREAETTHLAAKAAALLAKIVGLKPEEIVFVRMKPVDWPNACLGAEEAGEVCAEMITPGYRVELQQGGWTYVLHTNADGSTGRLGGPGELVAALRARQVAAQESNTALETVRLIHVERVEWPNSCLGVEKEGMICMQAITPGYRVTLEAGGQQVEYHTNLSATAIVK
jgi:hypothetical protein